MGTGRLPRSRAVRIKLNSAQQIRAEWETYLAQAEFAYSEDAMSKNLTDLEGFEESAKQPIFGQDETHGSVAEICDWWHG